jgi:D-alanyl-D-alanine carboxypeptidase
MAITKKQWLIYGGISLAVVVVLVLLIKLLSRNDRTAPAIKSSPLEDAEQEKFIVFLHEKAKNTFRTFIRRIEKETGWKVKITSGYRNYEAQAILHAKNNKNAKPGSSYHNYGMAIDINLEKNGVILKMASPKNQWVASGVPAIADDMNLEWGGNYPNYHDPIHFQPNRDKYPMKVLQAKGREQFGNDPKRIEGNKVKL